MILPIVDEKNYFIEPINIILIEFSVRIGRRSLAMIQREIKDSQLQYE